MTARPRHTRPNSAVYLGTDLAFSPPTIPDLPEPPSPVSSTGSGLPSPPATNSTGSGSTGDPASIAIRNSTASMLNASNIKAFHAAFVQQHPQDDDDDDDDDNFHANENDQDDTARLIRRHSLKSLPPNENALAIQRAMSLKERTRMTIDKLSSYSRNTPSPSFHPRNSNSSRRLSEQPHSGSETEREPIDSNSRPSTPKINRTRLISAPASPGNALLAIKQSNSSDSPSRNRKRASMATSDFAEIASERRIRSPDTQTSRRLPDVAQAALAAVASSRGRLSPVNSARKRQPLPREFFDAAASSSASGSGSAASVSRRGSLSGEDAWEPTTPYRTGSRPPSTTRHLQLSPRQQKNLNNALTNRYPHSDPRPNLDRPSTLRKGHQTGGRWVSEDMSVTSSHRDGDDEEDLSNSRGRKQTFRAGGSADSVLTVGAGGRSLVGEGLKAAGLRNGGTLGRRTDIFDENTPLRDKIARDRERAQRIERSISRASQSRISWEDDGDQDQRFSNSIRTRAGTVVGPRASTSMAILDREREGVGGDGGEPEPRTAPPHLRSYKSSFDLPLSQDAISRRDEDRAPSSLSHFGTSRRAELNVPDRSDHTKLLHDSLRMFESHVARVPSTSSATASDLLRNAQTIVSSAEKLNFMTRAAMSSALDAQINAEVESRAGDLTADIWRRVGAEYRDQMRVSDELVRSVTDFLLGVGRAVKDMTGGGLDGHGRSVSLDELSGRLTRSSLGSDGGSAGSGRRSAESRKSWGDDIQKLSKRPESGLGRRPSSVLNTRDLNNPPQDPPGRLATLDSQETVMALDPSPTPASRAGALLDRARTLPPLSIPKPLGQLPSESSTRRQMQTPVSTTNKRRPTFSGSNTVRGPFPLASPNIPTTALTPHTVSNGDRQDFPSLRPDLGSGPGKSSGTTSRSTVTFSRSSTVSALTGLQQQQQLAQQQRQRKRTQSNSSVSGPEDANRVSRTASGSSEGERGERGATRTVGRKGDRPRMSLDGSSIGDVHPADRSAANSILASTTSSRDRRRTVVDVWPRGAS
ncbi:hypothetical protein GYMLUDRAFT_52987 [Collybiopsis luxurians FD-317 M1]|nr:hypothetical protein GYMLUDRAFT_52987 [Collybiopsis luxurians FD-317 M1]